MLAAFVEIDLPTTGFYAEEYSELIGVIWVACPTLIVVGLLQEASSLLTALGFCSDRASRRKAISEASFTAPALMSWIIGILIFLSSPPGTFNDAEVNAIIPSPSFFARGPQSRLMQLYGVFEPRAFAALAMLKAGRDDDAFELASFTVSPDSSLTRCAAGPGWLVSPA